MVRGDEAIDNRDEMREREGSLDRRSSFLLLFQFQQLDWCQWRHKVTTSHYFPTNGTSCF